MNRRSFTRVLAASPWLWPRGAWAAAAPAADSPAALPAVLAGRWRGAGDAFHQTAPTGPALILTHAPDWMRSYTAEVRVRLASDTVGAAAGLALQVRGARNAVRFGLERRQAGICAVLRIVAHPGVDMVADQMLVPGKAADWHKLQARVWGPHIAGYLDGRPVVSFSFLAVAPPAHTGDSACWPVAPSDGRVGLQTANTAADFERLTVTHRDTCDCELVTPQWGRFDVHGWPQPRQSYADTMKQFTEWIAGADAVVDKHLAPESIRSLPVYVLANWVSSGDTVDLFGTTGQSLQVIQEFAINHSELISGAVRYYTFSGDTRALAIARNVADWHLANSTPAQDALPYLPPSSVNWQSDGSWKGQPWGLEPDKAAMMGLAMLKLAAAAGEVKYRRGALRIAGTLRKLQRPDGSWPFRVNPRTGEVQFGYTESALFYAQFFRRIAAITGRQEDREIGDRSWTWLLRNPVRTNDWRSFYGDVPSGYKSYDQWVPLVTVQYLLDQPQIPDRLQLARGILDWVEANLVVTPGLLPGIPGIIEQTAYRAVLTHHTLRLSQTYAALWRATGEQRYHDWAIRIANSVTWPLMSDGKMRLGFYRQSMSIPLVLSYNDQFADIMAAIPETAPRGENHLLRSTGDAGPIAYGAAHMAYSTLGAGEDTLTVRAVPRAIQHEGVSLARLEAWTQGQDGWSYEPDSGLLRVRHQAGRIEIGW